MQIKPEMRVKISGLQTLARKTLHEITQPQQFLSADRRRELIKNGIISLRGSFAHVELDTQQIEISIQEAIKHVFTPNFEIYYINTDNIHASVHLFPKGATAIYIPHSKEEANRISTMDLALLEISSARAVAVAVMTTQDLDYEGTSLPSEGLKTSRGIISRFRDRMPDDQVQHGGFFISNGNKSLELLSYEELVHNWDSPVPPDCSLIQANWYMDSKNQNEVCARDNLQERRTYNAIGKLYFPGKKEPQLFSFSTYYRSIFDTLQILDNAPTDLFEVEGQPCSTRDIAAFCNFISKENGAIGWRICGCEFNNGGTYVDPELMTQEYRDLLLIGIRPDSTALSNAQPKQDTNQRS